jgi:hypothetical protein
LLELHRGLVLEQRAALVIDVDARPQTGPIVAGGCFRCGAGGEVRGSFSETVRHKFGEIIDEFAWSAGLKGL